jgi:predicted ATPase
VLRRLSFTNFKSWPEADLECGRITGLFGTNSSGKTSILQFLLMLKQTREATDRTIALALDGPYVWLGTMTDILFRHDETRRIEAELSFDRAIDIRDPARPGASLATGDRLTVEFTIAAIGKAPRSESLAYTIRNEEGAGAKFSLVRTKSGSEERPFDLKADAGDFRFLRQPGRKWPLPPPGKFYSFPDESRIYFQNASFLADLENGLESFFNMVFYLGPLREYPKRDYLWARSKPVDVGQRGEKAIDAILAATAEGIEQNLKRKGRRKPFQEIVAHWLREMGLVHDFRIEEIAEGSNRWQAKVWTRKRAPEVLLTDVGFGISQVLPVITLLHYVPEGATVLLEQPEIHLHPLAQAELADVLIHAASHRRVQVIVESHSEHLLLRLQRRIAETRISAEDVRLYFCDIEKGASRLRPLEVDLYGNIRNWPKHFMGDAFGEAAAAEQARLDRMRREQEQPAA